MRACDSVSILVVWLLGLRSFGRFMGTLVIGILKTWFLMLRSCLLP